MNWSEFAIRAARKVTPTPEPSVEEQVVTEVKDAVGVAKDTAQSVMDQMPMILTHLAMALAVVIAGVIIIKIGKLIINGHSRRNKKGGRADTVRSITSSIFSYVMYFLMIAAVLRIFGVSLSSILAAAGVVSVAIAFGAQTLVKDIISGLFIWGEGNVSVGDLVSINDVTGTVEGISVRTTVLRNYNGDVYIIPNGDIRSMTNMSRGFRRAVVNIPCPYEADQDRIVAIVQDEMEYAAEEVDGIEQVPDVMSIVSFEKHAVMLQVAVVCPVGQHWRVERELRSRIKARFDHEGIMMPHYKTPVEE